LTPLMPSLFTSTPTARAKPIQVTFDGKEGDA
jgi:hypothetical protein